MPIWNRSPLFLIANKTKHPWRSQYLQVLFGGWHDSNKDVTAEHGDFHLASPVAPLVDFLEQRKKREDPLLLELPGDTLLMPRPGMDCIPIRFLRDKTPCRKLRRGFKRYPKIRHNSVPSVPILGFCFFSIPWKCFWPAPEQTGHDYWQSEKNPNRVKAVRE